MRRFGEPVVATRAANLLRGRNEGDEFLLWVGGRHAQGVLDGAPALYWPEVWGARALMSAWDDSAADAVVAGLGEPGLAGAGDVRQGVRGTRARRRRRPHARHDGCRAAGARRLGSGARCRRR